MTILNETIKKLMAAIDAEVQRIKSAQRECAESEKRLVELDALESQARSRLAALNEQNQHAADKLRQADNDARKRRSDADAAIGAIASQAQQEAARIVDEANAVAGQIVADARKKEKEIGGKHADTAARLHELNAQISQAESRLNAIKKAAREFAGD